MAHPLSYLMTELEDNRSVTQVEPMMTDSKDLKFATRSSKGSLPSDLLTILGQYDVNLMTMDESEDFDFHITESYIKEV